MPETILWLLAGWAIRVTMLAAVAGMLLWILRVKDASVLMAVWTAVLLGALLMPLVGFVAPALSISVPRPKVSGVGPGLQVAASHDAALRQAPDRLLYAEALVGFLEKARHRVRWEGVAMAKRGKATRRIERILDSSRMLSVSITPSVFAALAIAAMPVIYLAASARPAWAVNGNAGAFAGLAAA